MLILDLLFPKFNLKYQSPFNYLAECENLYQPNFKITNHPKKFLPEIQYFFPYHDEIIQDLLLRAKISGETAIISDFANFLAPFFQTLDFDLITFVPKDPVRSKKRGYHLPKIFATEIGKITKKPVLDLLKKTENTISQMTLDLESRQKNLENKFRINDYLELNLANYNQILLLDDVCISGSTLNYCTKSIAENFPFLNIKAVSIAG
jgi:predicted amidophosphoribosyltransferase